MRSQMQKIVGVARMMFAREVLPDLPEEARAGRLRARLLALLLAPEALPLDPPPPRRRGRSHLRQLFGPEPLPLDAPLPPRRRAHWLRWIFAPENPDQS